MRVRMADRFRQLVAAAHRASGKGVLAFERDLGLKGSSLRAILDERLSQVPSIDKAERIAEALGLEFYIGPPRQQAGSDAPARAAIHSLDEFTPRQMGLLDPLPGDAMFFVQPAFGIPSRIRPRSYCLVEPEAPLLDGDLVYIEDHRGGVNIGVYKGSTDNGWPVMQAHGGMEIEWNPAHLRRIAPITWTGRTPPPFVTADTAPSPSSRDNARITARIDRLAKELDELKEEIAG